MFELPFQVTWADLDANRHMRNSSYLEYASQSRFVFLAEHGFTPEAFAKHAIGPAILSDEISYRRELLFLDRFTVSLQISGCNEDGSRSQFLNRFTREDGKVACEIRTLFVWIDLNTRKIAPPPPALQAAMDALGRTEEFAAL
jgi:acyl-CoA thioester hydrolase